MFSIKKRFTTISPDCVGARKFRCVQFFLNSDADRLEQIKVEMLEFTKDHTCAWVTIVAWGGQDPKKNMSTPERKTEQILATQPANDCSPGRGGMAQDVGTRGGTFHDEMDHCRESQG